MTRCEEYEIESEKKCEQKQQQMLDDKRRDGKKTEMSVVQWKCLRHHPQHANERTKNKQQQSMVICGNLHRLVFVLVAHKQHQNIAVMASR